MTDVLVRAAIEADVAALNEIYNKYIVDSHVSFDTEAWSDQSRLEWFRERTAAGYVVLVACESDRIIGTSWSGPYRPRKAYLSSAETTVVLDKGESGRGVGSMLLSELVSRLTDSGFHRAIAIVALPNDGSVALHLKLGYREVGTLAEAGMKYGKYHSTMLLELALS